MNGHDLNLGHYQFRALKKLSAAGGHVDLNDMPDGITPDVIATLAQRGLLKASITITENGAQAVYRKLEILSEKEALGQRRLIRERVARAKARQALIDAAEERGDIRENVTLLKQSSGHKPYKPTLMPTEFVLDRRKLTGCR